MLTVAVILGLLILANQFRKQEEQRVEESETVPEAAVHWGLNVVGGIAVAVLALLLLITLGAKFAPLPEVP